MNAVEAQADRVGERRTKDVIFAERHQVPETVAGIPEARKICIDCAACRRLLAKILLHDVVAVNAISVGQLHVKIGRPLVESHVS